MRIITIDREFGSGGREIGKRLSDALGIPVYDEQIIYEVANEQNIAPELVERISQNDISRVYPTTIGRTLTAPFFFDSTPIDVLVSQQEVIRKLASNGDCIIIGRSADVLMEDMNPFKIFVYADEKSKVKRSLERSDTDESEDEIRRKIKKIDKARAKNRRLLTDKPWGRILDYDICINTSNKEIKDLIPGLVAYINECYKN